MVSTVSLTAQQVRLVNMKVDYSENDSSFNSYLDVVNKVMKLSNTILRGELPEDGDGSSENSQKVNFDKDSIKELKQLAELRYLELQTSLETKKTIYENWEQSNESIVKRLSSDALNKNKPMLEKYKSELQQRMFRIREMYNAVKKINREVEALVVSKTTLMVTYQEWVDKLGKEFTDKLIARQYLKPFNREVEGKYKVFDNFNRTPEELKKSNEAMKVDIEKLTVDLTEYKDKWLKDADVFSKVSSLLMQELENRNIKLDTNEEEEEEEDEEEDEDRRRYLLNKEIEGEMDNEMNNEIEDEMADMELDNDINEDPEGDMDDEDEEHEEHDGNITSEEQDDEALSEEHLDDEHVSEEPMDEPTPEGSGSPEELKDGSNDIPVDINEEKDYGSDVEMS
ncbi:hypothetical protein Kpol_520p37 [Vanderwaltozyma polyspora DSM 70294]|uniref:Uncharacterized protein n=1 Tax=Vanderwaltozyma polyspora (strain ATCC 22028 / DSM 70294 / BCRC 21397 / CBS 2163 / NBRC 10782 / NRRL Y-8283 / UCD 57-17) TaxID=436907 RepID=A7TMC0_VANPO|nr:uncharacterized protein Kpol_520p37 [Vanderwaltozyma polyspora DSM 70294]EDO16614.1 hypothetical protein Kpol_520p37 [Vanderwaltozyma polyspora DSM 70294]